VAPAIGNAIYELTGKRIRALAARSCQRYRAAPEVWSRA
jgi:hypothetical protein